MADQGRWFKLWCSAMTDEKLQSLTLEDFARWALFGMYMKQHGQNGKIILHPPCRMLAAILRLDSFNDVKKTLSDMPNLVVENVVTKSVTSEGSKDAACVVRFRKWKAYQGDMSRDRVAKYREKKALQKGSNVTPKKRGEEKRGEESTTPTQFVALWNDTCTNLSKVKEVSKARLAKIKLRLKERPIAEWKTVFHKLNASDFCCGINDKNWKASFDWIISNTDNAIKTLEGKYDNRVDAMTQNQGGTGKVAL